jgi:ADP-ribosylglycohydrolase
VKKWICCLFLLAAVGVTIPAEASLIYRCVDELGAVSYQATACPTAHPDNKTLSIVTHTSPAAVKAAAAQERAALKKKAQEQRQQQKTFRCEQARTEKEDLQALLRHGYPAKSKPQLKQRLKDIENRERRYCQATRHH